MQYLGAVSKMTEWSLFPRQTIQYHSHPRQCHNHQCRRSWTVLWRPSRPSRTNTKKGCPFYHRGLECKSRKSRDTWSNRRAWPWSTKWSRAKANQVLPRERTGHSKHPLPMTQERTLNVDIMVVNIEIWLYSLQPKREKLYTVIKNKNGSTLWLRSWTPYFQIQT